MLKLYRKSAARQWESRDGVDQQYSKTGIDQTDE